MAFLDAAIDLAADKLGDLFRHLGQGAPPNFFGSLGQSSAGDPFRSLGQAPPGDPFRHLGLGGSGDPFRSLGLGGGGDPFASLGLGGSGDPFTGVGLGPAPDYFASARARQATLPETGSPLVDALLGRKGNRPWELATQSAASLLNGVPDNRLLPHLELINRVASESGVPAAYWAAAILAESSGDPTAVGDQGLAHGLLQNHLRGRGRGYSPQQLRDPELNLRIAIPEFRAAYQRATTEGLVPGTAEHGLRTIALAQRFEGYDNPQSPAASRVRGFLDQTLRHVYTPEAKEPLQGVFEGTRPILPGVDQNELGLDPETAAAACGPAAAVWFARHFGRQPTAIEAMNLAKQVGWNPAQGMAGPRSQVALLQRLGANARLVEHVNWQTVAQNVQAGRPVIIDTPKHYFQVTGYDPGTGRFRFGDAVGRKYSNGLTPQEFERIGWGYARSAIYIGD